MRTTIDIDDPILRDLKRLQQREGKSLGRLVSDLLAQSLAAQRAAPPEPVAFRWTSRPMRARIDLCDKDAVRDALDDESPR
ncbi:antitoxin [Azohydromonas sediminis]|uniref:antitoxin n=1 Tax=Azohydromonas sediminis TaxID=2259674 RepID=UPI000E64B827|nr:antitoxin [Azohydromonas sediminis]